MSRAKSKMLYSNKNLVNKVMIKRYPMVNFSYQIFNGWTPLTPTNLETHSLYKAATERPMNFYEELLFHIRSLHSMNEVYQRPSRHGTVKFPRKLENRKKTRELVAMVNTTAWYQATKLPLLSVIPTRNVGRQMWVSHWNTLLVSVWRYLQYVIHHHHHNILTSYFTLNWTYSPSSSRKAQQVNEKCRSQY